MYAPATISNRLIKLGIILCLCSSAGYSESLEILEFYPDANEQTIPISDPSCLYFIDDSSNYRVELVGTDEIKVTGIGTSDRSASLIVDCPMKTAYFALRFNSRRKYGFDSEARPRLGQSDSYFGISATEGALSGHSKGLDVVDRSLRIFQLTIREGLPTGALQGTRSESVDVAHEGERWRIGYGVERMFGIFDQKMSYRSFFGFDGMSLAHSHSRYLQSGETESSSWMRLPAPLNFGFGYQKGRDDVTLRTIDRFFPSSVGSLSIGSTIRYSHETNPVEGVRELLRIKVDESLRSSSLLRPGNYNSFECTSTKNCLMTEWVTRNTSNFRDNSLTLEYGLLPHSISANMQSKFGKRHNTGMQIRHNFKDKSFVNRWAFVSKDLGPGATAESSTLHLEFGGGKWTYFVDQSATMIKKDIRGSVAGFRFDGDKVQASASVSRFQPTKGPFSFVAEFRYFFDENIRSLALRSSKTKIDVAVLSNAGDKPVGGVVVNLLLNNTVIGSAVSSPEGRVAFTEGRCCEEYVVQAEHLKQTMSAVVLISPGNLERSVKLYVNDHKKVQVEFFLQSTKNGLEKLNIQNYFPEIGEGILGHHSAVYSNNSLLIPIAGLVDLTMNEQLLPFQYRLISVSGDKFDTTVDGVQVVRILVEEK